MHQIRIPSTLSAIDALVTPATSAKYVMLLAHGAGAGMHHPFLHSLAEALSQWNGTIIRYQFPYMQQGQKLPKSPQPDIDTVGAVVEWARLQWPNLPLFVGGKSYGGRMSSHRVATHPVVSGLVYVGFPLHSGGKPSVTRASHLPSITLPQLFVQGTQDELADWTLLQQVVSQCPRAELFTLEGANHSFAIPKKVNPETLQQRIERMAIGINEWALRQIG